MEKEKNLSTASQDKNGIREKERTRSLFLVRSYSRLIRDPRLSLLRPPFIRGLFRPVLVAQLAVLLELSMRVFSHCLLLDESFLLGVKTADRLVRASLGLNCRASGVGSWSASAPCRLAASACFELAWRLIGLFARDGLDLRLVSVSQLSLNAKHTSSDVAKTAAFTICRTCRTCDGRTTAFTEITG